MNELVRTNDLVVISYVEALLRDTGIACHVFDQYTSVVEGSIGAIQRRVMVDSERVDEARRLLIDAGLGMHIAGQET